MHEFLYVSSIRRNKKFVKGEVLHLLGTNSSRFTFNKKRTEFQNTHKEWRIPRWQFWEVYLGSYFCRWERLDWEHKEENNFFFAQSRPALPNIKNLRIRKYHLKTDRTNENYYKDRKWRALSLIERACSNRVYPH